jgi:cytochrome c oxidase assembly protein subunit 15
VQFHHRIVAYVLTVVAIVAAVKAWRSSYLAEQAKVLAAAIAVAVIAQAVLGIVTLMAVVPIGLGIAHQLMAAAVLALATAFAWRVRRP